MSNDSEARFDRADLPDQGAFGAMVTNLDPADIDHEPTRQALHDLWVDRGVIVFRGVAGGEETQIRLSLIFGDLEEHPLTKGTKYAYGRPELSPIKYVPGEGDAYEIDGEVKGAWLPWHSDLVYVDRINRGGILAPVRLPRSGGETGFIDQIMAYELLPADLRQQIESLNAVYRFNLDMLKNKFAKKPQRCLRRSEKYMGIEKLFEGRPRVIHPMVYTQGATGRKILNVSPWFAEGIEGMENARGDALLREVIDSMMKTGAAYYHKWRDGDMVLWDNWRMLHCAEGVPVDEERLMQRTTIAGDYALGRAEIKGESLPDALRINI